MRPDGEHVPVLFVPAHPDDEVVSASAVLESLAPRLLFLHLTDGAPRNLFDARNYGFDSRERYAAARRLELEAALKFAGIHPDRLMSLGAVDQEASFDLESLTRRLEALLLEIRPAEVWTHPYEGGHPDHDAAAFIVHAAVRLLGRRSERAPRVVEFSSYHAAGEGVAVLEFLPRGDCPETACVLSREARERKRRMIECFATQRATLAMFPVGAERSRLAPAYDFTRPPHEGVLHYDRYDWGVHGDRWRELAGAALGRLGIEGAM